MVHLSHLTTTTVAPEAAESLTPAEFAVIGVSVVLFLLLLGVCLHQACTVYGTEARIRREMVEKGELSPMHEHVTICGCFDSCGGPDFSCGLACTNCCLDVGDCFNCPGLPVSPVSCLDICCKRKGMSDRVDVFSVMNCCDDRNPCTNFMGCANSCSADAWRNRFRECVNDCCADPQGHPPGGYGGYPPGGGYGGQQGGTMGPGGGGAGYAGQYPPPQQGQYGGGYGAGRPNFQYNNPAFQGGATTGHMPGYPA